MLSGDESCTNELVGKRYKQLMSFQPDRVTEWVDIVDIPTHPADTGTVNTFNMALDLAVQSV